MSLSVRAQELNCNVKVNAQGVNSINQQVVQDMEQNFRNFLNNRRWTRDVFKTEERIQCNIIINLMGDSDPAANFYRAKVQIQSARPVYNTTYQTLLLSYLDQKWEFEYAPMQPLDFNENAYTSNITSLLAFYAYFVIGYDYDSFAKQGGNPHFSIAQQIAVNAAQGGRGGWQAFDGTNDRYFLIENMMNAQMQPFRQGIYDYHRLALDTFLDDADQSRRQTLEFLKKLRNVRQQMPMSLVLNLFFDAKGSELTSFFMEASPQEKQEAYNLLAELDPTKTDRYQQLIR